MSSKFMSRLIYICNQVKNRRQIKNLRLEKRHGSLDNHISVDELLKILEQLNSLKISPCVLYYVSNLSPSPCHIYTVVRLVSTIHCHRIYKDLYCPDKVSRQTTQPFFLHTVSPKVPRVLKHVQYFLYCSQATPCGTIQCF